MRTKEEILHSHVSKEHMDEVSVNAWPHILEAMEEYRNQSSPMKQIWEVSEYMMEQARNHMDRAEGLSGDAKIKNNGRGAGWKYAAYYLRSSFGMSRVVKPDFSSQQVPAKDYKALYEEAVKFIQSMQKSIPLGAIDLSMEIKAFIEANKPIHKSK